MVGIEKIDKQIASLEEEISRINSDLLHKFPVELYLNDIGSYPDLQVYRHFSSQLDHTLKLIAAIYGRTALTLYHKLALSRFIRKAQGELQKTEITGSIRNLYSAWFERIIQDFSEQPDEFYDHETDLFCKDLGVCSLRMIPVGCEVLEMSGIGRRLFLSGGIGQFFAYLHYTIKMGGFKPLYAIHLDMRYLGGFNPKGRDLCYLRIAELLKQNPQVKGMMGVSWFYDPAVEEISPWLAYLRKRPENNGAKVFRVGVSARDIRLSTLKSRKRARLYKEGKYKPTGYMLIWPRKELIEWADRHVRTYENEISEALIDEQIELFTEQLSHVHKDFLQQYPIKAYLDIVNSYTKLHFYRDVSPRLSTMFDEIATVHGFPALVSYHKLALSSLIKESIDELPGMKLPDSVFQLYHDWYQRIVSDFSAQPDEFYNYRKDLFCKDLAVCSRTMIPIGFLIEVSGIGRKFLGAGGIPQFFNGLFYAIFKMHGLKPFYSVHLDMRYLRKYFSQRGWAKCYYNIAKLLRLNPEIKGLIGGSWFYDPQLDEVSPNLSHLRTVPEAYGGKVYRIGTSEQDIRLAAANSPQRTKLIMDGKYKPTHYVIIWPRKGIIEWAEEYEREHAE